MTGVGSAQDDVAELPEDDKRALLAQLLGQDHDWGSDRLLPAQRRYWVLHQVSPQLPTHTLRVLDVDGEIGRNELERALAALIDAHEELRTGFPAVEGRPLRVVGEAGAVVPELTVLDVTGPEETAKARVREAGRPFRLEAAPLVRAAILRQVSGDGTVVRSELVFSAHQVIADEITMDILLRQLIEAYDVVCAGGTPAPVTSTVPFTRVVDRLSAWLGTPHARRDLDFWVKSLTGVTPVDLPTDHPRPVDRVPSLLGGRRTTALPADLVGGISQLAESSATSVPSVVLAGLVEVLARYTRNLDIAVGVPTSGREPEHADVLAPLENTVVVRTLLDGGPSFRELTALVHANWGKAVDHQRTPFERVVAEVQPETDLSRSPLHQVKFVPRDSGTIYRGGGLTWEVAEAETGLSAFDLTVHLAEYGDGRADLHAEYNAEIFEPSTVDLLLGHLVALLASAVAEPDRASHQLPILTEAEQERVLREWNDTAADFPRATCLHELIEQQASQTPDALAVIAGTERLTYRELDQWANRLANRLRDEGVGPEALVGVIASRRAETVVGFLAVLKAGGAYVPIDPEQPVERMRTMLSDAGVRVVLAADEKAMTLQEAPCDTWIGIDDVVGYDDTAPESGVGPGNIAYVIYTSGSTGTPKGVVIPHRQIVNSTLARTAFGREAPESYAIPVSLSFDASAAGLYWTLITGGRVVLPDEEQVRNPVLLARLVQAEQITHITHMPSYYQLLLSAGGRKLMSLRDISAGGDVFPAQLAIDHYKQLPWARLYNDYGPTEVTVWATAQLAEAEEAGASVPIGRPIQNTRVYLLDGELNPVPIGVPGEIYIAGENIARGYHGQPRMTADRFVPDPFSASGGRLYRSGDLARYLPDGRLEFVGRADTQVKIRGFRIELGEIENALQRDAAVLSAVVVVRRNAINEENELVGYVRPADGAEPPTADHLTAHLRKLLPQYMIPSAFVTCEEFPVNAHGKVDRAALPAPAAKQVALPSSDVPRKRIEREIAEVFAEALGIPRVGLHDDFFSFGGSSLQLSRVGAQLSKAYGLELPLHALFSTPTVAGVAARVELYERDGFAGLRATRDAVDDLDHEAQLEESITGENLAFADFDNPKAVFLTGATGYFGVFLLEQLLEQTNADVYCLVRAGDPAAGMGRLRASCDAYEVPWDDRFDRRVKAVCGDLTKPLFGLSPDSFDELARIVDVIYHNGAWVNFSIPYSALKASNVDGTVEMLRLAAKYKAKQVHFVSTIDVFIAGHMTRPYLELELPAKPPQVPFSYPQSKWVSEKIILKARQRGLPVTIFRPSIMMGHPKTGACHAQNYVLTALRGFLEFGVLPDYAESMNAITLDYASKAMVHVSRQEESLGNIYHLWNTKAIGHNELFPWIKSYGYPFDVIPFDDALQLAIDAGPDHPVYPMVPVLLLYSSGDAGVEMTMGTEDAIDNSMECANLLKGIEGTGWEPAPLDEKYMHQCLDFLVRHGHLDPPEAFPRKR